MDELIAALKACRTADGLLAAPYGDGEEGYSFMLLAHGLVAAADAGNRDANDLLAAWAKWYRRRVDTSTAGNPRSILDTGQNYFAATALMLDYFAPDGRPENVLSAYKHVHPEWMGSLAARTSKPFGRCRGASAFSLLLRMDWFPRYLPCHGRSATLGSNVGRLGAIPRPLAAPRRYPCHLRERPIIPPIRSTSLPITHTGETCSMVWWARFNHKLHQLYPADERYVAEIEKVIYNVGLANQAGKSISYHTRLEGRKDSPEINHTCCEVVGSYLYATLPQYIYSLGG